MTASATGAPAVVCAQLRDALRGSDLTPRLAAHLDAVVERAVHAYRGTAESVTVTLQVTDDVFTLAFA